MLNWHEITPLSRMLAIIVFLGIVPALSFYLGMQYQDMLATKSVMRTYDFPKLEHYTGITIEQLESATTSK
jgi:fructose-specific phosphotransferase system IIC component